MKKSIILSCFLLTSVFAFSQDVLTPKVSTFSIGPSFGYGHSYLTPYNCEFNPTWSAGITSIYAPYEHFGFGMDVRYSSEAGKMISVRKFQLDQASVFLFQKPILMMHMFGRLTQV